MARGTPHLVLVAGGCWVQGYGSGRWPLLGPPPGLCHMPVAGDCSTSGLSVTMPHTAAGQPHGMAGCTKGLDPIMQPGPSITLTAAWPLPVKHIPSASSRRAGISRTQPLLVTGTS